MKLQTKSVSLNTWPIRMKLSLFVYRFRSPFYSWRVNVHLLEKDSLTRDIHATIAILGWYREVFFYLKLSFSVIRVYLALVWWARTNTTWPRLIGTVYLIRCRSRGHGTPRPASQRRPCLVATRQFHHNPLKRLPVMLDCCLSLATYRALPSIFVSVCCHLQKFGEPSSKT